MAPNLSGLHNNSSTKSQRHMVCNGWSQHQPWKQLTVQSGTWLLQCKLCWLQQDACADAQAIQAAQVLVSSPQCRHEAMQHLQPDQDTSRPWLMIALVDLISSNTIAADVYMLLEREDYHIGLGLKVLKELGFIDGITVDHRTNGPHVVFFKDYVVCLYPIVSICYILSYSGTKMTLSYHEQQNTRCPKIHHSARSCQESSAWYCTHISCANPIPSLIGLLPLCLPLEVPLLIVPLLLQLVPLHVLQAADPQHHQNRLYHQDHACGWSYGEQQRLGENEHCHIHIKLWSDEWVCESAISPILCCSP